MDEKSADQIEVMGFLEPYFARIFPIFGAAVDFYNSEYSRSARAQHDDRATACDVWCHIWHGMQVEFGEERGFHFLEIRGLSVLNVRDRVVIRAKKVDENGRHRNSDTLQQRLFDAQMPLPGLPEAAARLIIGYQPDAAFSRVERVTIRRPFWGWVSQVVETEHGCSWVDITPRELPFGKGLRRAS
jgi:hypothetical protein